MIYVALLRGINVGGNKKVDMKKLKATLEALGCTEVITYLNSGNALFKSKKTIGSLEKAIQEALSKEFGFDIQTLIKTSDSIKKIATSIPNSWQNNTEQKTDVAYLFPEIDSKTILNDLPIKKELLILHYVPGALIWHVNRKDYNKSNLNKIIGTKAYQHMTIRNVNTAKRLAELAQSL